MDSSSGIGLSAEMEHRSGEFGTDSSAGGKPEHEIVNPGHAFLLTPTSDTVVTALPQPMFPAASRPQPTPQTVGYSLREKPLPNTQIDFGEIMRQQRVREQHKLAASWSKTSKEVESETLRLRTCLYTTWDPTSALEMVNKDDNEEENNGNEEENSSNLEDDPFPLMFHDDNEEENALNLNQS